MPFTTGRRFNWFADILPVADESVTNGMNVTAGNVHCSVNAHLFASVRPKECLRTCAKCADSDHSVHSQSIIRAFARHSYILWYPIFLLVDSEGPGHTTQMPRLIWVYLVHILALC